MAGKQNNLSPEELARLEQIRAARMAAIKQGIDNLKNGQHRALEQLGFLNTETTDLADLSEDDLAKTKALFAQIFGQDPEDPAKGLLGNPTVLNGFHFRRSPQNEPVKQLVPYVKANLQASPKFAGREIPDAELLPYVQAEILRQMVRPGSQLTYDDGKEKIENISVPVVLPVEEPEEKLAAIRDRSNQNGRKYFQILQELGLMQVGPDEIGIFLAGRQGTVQSLAQVYDYLFGQDEQYALDQFRVVFNQGGLRNTQTLDELYAEQYQGPAQTPEAKQAFQKAMVVNALANGSHLEVTHNGENLLGLGEAFHGQTAPQSLRQDARDELRATHNFSGAQLPACNNVHLDFSVYQIQQAVGEMLGNINRCDKSYIRSSEAFITMKKHLKALNKLVNETWRQQIANDRPITLEMMSEFLEKADALKGDIRTYLDKKQGDIAANPSSRQDPESYEQRRIQANIQNLEALGKLTKTVESQVLKGISGKARAYFNKDLELLGERRPDLTAADREELNDNVLRSADRFRQLSEDAYRRHTALGKRETLLQARDRILGSVEREYDAAYRTALADRNDISDMMGDNRLDQELRNETHSNAYLQKQLKRNYKLHDKLATVEDPEISAVENYRYQLLPTDKKTLLDNSDKNATVVPFNLREGISFLDDIYGFHPHVKPKYLYDDMAASTMDARQTGEHIHILTDEEIKCDFKAIYQRGDPAAGDAKLSEKDFAALAIAGARTPQSFALAGSRASLKADLDQGRLTQNQYDGKLFEINDGFTSEEQRLRKVSSYTFSRCDPPTATDRFSKEYFPCINNGRKMASRAMEEYEKNNLKPLAKLIAFGITDIIACTRDTTYATQQSPAAEMCKRMSNMLDRDPELKKEALRQGLKEQDLKMIDAMRVQGALFQKAKHGLKLWQKRPDLVTGDVKLSIMADMYISKLVDSEYKNLEHNVLAKQPAYANAVAEADRNYNLAEDNHDPRVAVYAEKNNGVRDVENKKLRYQDKFAETMAKPGTYEKLKRKVIKMLKETELHTMGDGAYSSALQRLGYVKGDTGKTSTLSYLQNYKKQPKNEQGFYKMKEFLAFRQKHYEEKAAAIEARNAYQQAQAEQQAAQPGGLHA